MPIIIKFKGIRLVSKKVFRSIERVKPKNAPINRLGANTPPSPPEARVAEVTIGFRNKIPSNVIPNGSVNKFSFEENIIDLIAWYPSPYNSGNMNNAVLRIMTLMIIFVY